MTRNILWTGGWDSTFLLMRIIFTDNHVIQPYYIIDSGRPSTRMEMVTINKIKEYIARHYPEKRELILPTIFFDKNDVLIDATISSSYQKLYARYKFGNQYLWLSSFAKQKGVLDLEMSIENSGRNLHRIINSLASKGDDGKNRIAYKQEYEDIFNVYRYFSFPLVGISKLDMRREAKEKGWLPIMNLSWFCHTPTRRGKPCGYCNPCRYTISEGLPDRIPTLSILTGKIKMLMFENKLSRILIRNFRKLQVRFRLADMQDAA